MCLIVLTEPSEGQRWLISDEINAFRGVLFLFL